MTNKLKERRMYLQMTQSDVAIKCGISLRQYRNIETGKAVTSVQTAKSIATVLKDSVENLF